MKFMRMIVAVAVATLVASSANAQPPTKVAAENELLKKFVGDWDLTMKLAGAETKGTMTYKLDLEGMWLSSTLHTELFGMKYIGKGLDSYDPATKKYVSIWVDSMSANPTVMEGSLDAAKKKLTLTGDGKDMSGKTVKMKSITEMSDDDTILFTMFEGDAKEPMFTVTYKRKK